MTPISQLLTTIVSDKKGKYEKMAGNPNTVLMGNDKYLQGKPLRMRAMQTWINAANSLLAVIAM